MRRRQYLAAAGGTVAVTGCLGLGPTTDDYDVGMTAEAFRPRQVTVEVGDSVVWYNGSTRAHSVTAYGDGLPDDGRYFATGGFESEPAAREAWDRNRGVLTTDQRFEHEFRTPGTFAYFCIPHEEADMVGSVTVEG